ncbi:hypothetical protein EHM92_08250, partial [bacterium]
MKTFRHSRSLLWMMLFASFSLDAQTVPREQWGAPLVSVSQKGTVWSIAGQKHTVTVDRVNLGMKVEAAGVDWAMVPSEDSDMVVKSSGIQFFLRLADAGTIEFKPYDTGYKTGVKLRLERFRHDGKELDLALSLTICLEGKDEDLVCDVAAIEHEASVRQLDWPKALDAREVEYTVLSNGRGNLIPRNWPQAYDPINHGGTDKSFVESNLIECWSMSWWGFKKGNAALAVFVETPDDAAYKFSHPAGGPTVVGPRWRASLGKLGYLRSVRMCFMPEGNYVTMAKRYRRHAIDIGQFVSLKEKIARNPLVADLIGTPHLRQSIKRNYKPGSFRYDTADP